jgi:predicted site-specific integrase-resolvase
VEYQHKVDELLTISDVAKTFEKSEETIQRWVRKGLFLSPIRPGGANSTPYWRVVDMNEFLAAGGIVAYRRNRRQGKR